MATIDYCTEQAIAARVAAEHEPLPRRRLQYLQSAERWEMMARQAEDLQKRTAVNEEGRRLRPYQKTLRETAR